MLFGLNGVFCLSRVFRESMALLLYCGAAAADDAADAAADAVASTAMCLALSSRARSRFESVLAGFSARFCCLQTGRKT